MIHAKDVKELFEVFGAIEDQKEAEKLLRDILTPAEIETVAERWQIAKGLLSGDSQRKVAENVGGGVATVTRGSKMIQYGSGGFKHFFKKLKRNG